MTLKVGCSATNSLIGSSSFYNSASVFVDLTSATGVYTFYEPTPGCASTYCVMTAHTITNILVDSVSSTDAVSFTTTCSPTLADPSCSSIDVLNNTYEHTIVFYIDTYLEGLAAPLTNGPVTITVAC